MTREDGPHLDRYGNCDDSDDDRFLHLCMTHSGIANTAVPELPRPLRTYRSPSRGGRHSGCNEWRLCGVADAFDMDYPGSDTVMRAPGEDGGAEAGDRRGLLAEQGAGRLERRHVGGADTAVDEEGRRGDE
jgi:hypothetical protein